MTESALDLILDGSAVPSAFAILLGFLAQATSLMPRDLDDRLRMLLDTCQRKRAILLRDLLNTSLAAGSDVPTTTIDSPVQDYVSSLDRYLDRRRHLQVLAGLESSATRMLVGGCVLAVAGLAAGVALRHSPVMVWSGVLGLLAVVLALVIAHHVCDSCKRIEYDPDFLRGEQ